MIYSWALNILRWEFDFLSFVTSSFFLSILYIIKVIALFVSLIKEFIPEGMEI